MKKTAALILVVLALAALFCGCMGSDDTVQSLIVADCAYTEAEALERAEQPETLKAGSEVCASVGVIESYRGMEYTARWLLDGAELKTETKATQSDMRDVLVFKLEAEKAGSGTLRLELYYKDELLCARELVIE